MFPSAYGIVLMLATGVLIANEDDAGIAKMVSTISNRLEAP
jgi:hypothetical protein